MLIVFLGVPSSLLTSNLACIYCMCLLERDKKRLTPYYHDGKCALKLNNINSWSVLNILQSPCPFAKENPMGVLITLSPPGLFTCKAQTFTLNYQLGEQ